MINHPVDECIENLIKYDPALEPSPVPLSNHTVNGNTEMQDDDADILIESEQIVGPSGRQQTSSTPSATPNKYTGAIPKKANTAYKAFQWPVEPSRSTTMSSIPSAAQPITFSSLMKNFTPPKIISSPGPPRAPADQSTAREHPKFLEVTREIQKGHRVLVLMRGAPGSGKSHLARRLVDETSNGDYENHIFSTDDFFFDKRQKKYVYNRDFLDQAHNANQAKVAQKTLYGWSPVIVDNTNMKAWEMFPYVSEGVKNGYLIKILEPNTPWVRSAGKLALKNKHGVPKMSIERMLEKYERTSPEDLMRLCRVNYTHLVPILRCNPPWRSNPFAAVENNKENAKAGLNRAANALNGPRDQRKRRQPPIPSQAPILTNVVENDETDTFQMAAAQISNMNNEWTAFDQNVGLVPWDPADEEPTEPTDYVVAKPQRQKPSTELNGIYDLLRDRNVEPTETTMDPKMEGIVDLRKHEKGCAKENESFLQIRQIYPTIPVSYIWDLFEKCNGDADWTMDILLKEEDDGTTNSYEKLETEAAIQRDNFACACRSGSAEMQKAVNAIPAALLLESPEPPATPPPIQSKSSRRDRIETENESSIRRQIEEAFAISDDRYSPHVRKIRDLRRGVQQGGAQGQSTSMQQNDPTESAADMDIDEDGAEDACSGEGEEVIEMDLGVELVCQLDSVFGIDAFQRETLKDMKTTVFMPRSLGQQLYAIWMESLYNQIEEQRQKSIRDDEEFAKQLHLKEKYPKLMQNTPSTNLKDIMEMEYAWKAYKSDVDEWKKTTPQDLASKMTRAKLFEIFPNVDRGTLVEVLAAHDNKFSKTVEVLKDNMKSDVGQKMEVVGQRLLSEARIEAQAVSCT